MKEIIKRFEQALLHLDKIAAQRLLAELGLSLPPIEIAGHIVVPALESIGKAWQEGRLALSQIYMSGKICEELINDILPTANPLRKNQPKMAITTLNDYHLLGKRIVYSHLHSAGYELIDYGRTNVEELIANIQKDELEIILISTLMYPSALLVKEVRSKLKRVTPEIKIIVGGAPFNMDEQLWRAVGADAMGHNSAEAVQIVSNLFEEI